MNTAEKLRQEGIAEGRKDNLFLFVRRSSEQGSPLDIIAKIVELDENLIKNIEQ